MSERDPTPKRTWFTEDRSLSSQLLEYLQKRKRNEITAEELRQIQSTYVTMTANDWPRQPITALEDAVLIAGDLARLPPEKLVRMALEHIDAAGFNQTLLLFELCNRVCPGWNEHTS
jgi:hypothetical protein